MEREIRSWSERERALCEAYLLTRVYSVSYVRVVSVRPGYALIRFGSVFRDVGLDFELDFEARVRWSGTPEHATVTWRGTGLRQTSTSVLDPAVLAQSVFSVFKRVQKREVAKAMRQLARSSGCTCSQPESGGGSDSGV